MPAIDIKVMPFSAWMGITLIETSTDLVVAEMPVRDDLCTAGAICHGGAYMAFADAVGAVATVINLPEGTRTTTVESKTNFVGVIRAGDVARAECRPVHKGSTTMVWQTNITRPDGKLAAVVTQTQLIMPARR